MKLEAQEPKSVTEIAQEPEFSVQLQLVLGLATVQILPTPQVWLKVNVMVPEAGECAELTVVIQELPVTFAVIVVGEQVMLLTVVKDVH